MSISINEIRQGKGLRIDGVIFLVTEYHHVKPGKGSAFVRVKLKNVETDAVIERTFKSSEKLDDVSLEENDLQFLYQAGDTFFFMDHATFEQIGIAEDTLGDATRFLLENLECRGIIFNHKVLKVILPNFIHAQIVETEPGIRGDSSRAGTKPGKIQSGAIIQVPLFINQEDWIRIDTRTGEYVERIQK